MALQIYEKRLSKVLKYAQPSHVGRSVRISEVGGSGNESTIAASCIGAYVGISFSSVFKLNEDVHLKCFFRV